MPDTSSPIDVPAAEKHQLDIGFIRLTDSAPLVVARERGFFHRYGLDVQLLREVSWANLRDKVAVGTLDAAQMLAPLPLVTTLGAAGIRCPMLTGLTLSLNGNAITLSRALSEKLELESLKGGLEPVPLSAEDRGLSMAKALGKQLKQQRGDFLTFATVHPYSSHTCQLRSWLAAGGINPDTDVRIIVLPPEQMVDSLARGILDGFCVGEPWNTVAVQSGIGDVAVTGYEIWQNAPEKVLAVTEKWHQENPGTHLRLRLAIMEASEWLSQPENRASVATLLSSDEYLKLPEQNLLPSLLGDFCYSKGTDTVSMPDFHVFHRYCAGFPWRSQAALYLQQTEPLIGKRLDDKTRRDLVNAVYRTDLYRQAAEVLGWQSPSVDEKTEGSHSEGYELEPGITLGPDLMLAHGEP